MNWNSLACVSNFDDGTDLAYFEEIERDRREDIVSERMSALNADTLQDVLDAAGSFNKFFQLSAVLLSEYGADEELNLHKLYACVRADVKALVYKEENETSKWNIQP